MMAPGNTFKATAKPVLIGTAVVGAYDDDFLDHYGADLGTHGSRRNREIVAHACAVHARTD